MQVANVFTKGLACRSPERRLGHHFQAGDLAISNIELQHTYEANPKINGSVFLDFSRELRQINYKLLEIRILNQEGASSQLSAVVAVSAGLILYNIPSNETIDKFFLISTVTGVMATITNLIFKGCNAPYHIRSKLRNSIDEVAHKVELCLAGLQDLI